MPKGKACPVRKDFTRLVGGAGEASPEVVGGARGPRFRDSMSFYAEPRRPSRRWRAPNSPRAQTFLEAQRACSLHRISCVSDA